MCNFHEKNENSIFFLNFFSVHCCFKNTIKKNAPLQFYEFYQEISIDLLIRASHDAELRYGRKIKETFDTRILQESYASLFVGAQYFASTLWKI